MNKIVECVPNFSEGRDPKIINAISEAIKNTSGVKLLDVDPGKSTNRTVYTFVGDPHSIVEGALNAARVAKELIDMTKHSGEHPRMGALDVCPFVPVANVTMEECVECSIEFAKRAAVELDIPIYLYENSQDREYRKYLPDIRNGEYEGLKDKITKDEWKPDFGPQKFVASWGATVTGARFFLIAYNINVLATHNQAHRIALNLRAAGRGDSESGRLPQTKGIGWYVEEYGMSQISMNLNNFLVTPPHIAFEEAKKDANELGVALAGSELIGLIPLQAMLMAADYYIEKENLFIPTEEQKIKLVIDRLGLNSISQFIPEKRIIEYIIKEEPNEPLASLSTRKFIEAVAARTTAPGGGSVAASIASLGAALGAMVAWLTYGVRKFENVQKEMQSIIPNLQDSVQKLIPFIDADTNAFNDYIDAIRLPQTTDEEKQFRDKAMQNGLKKAVDVPLNLMITASSIWDEFVIAAKYGNIASKSDLEVGARALELGIWGAGRNVHINLEQIKDDHYKIEVSKKAEELMNLAKLKCEEILDILNGR